MGANRIDLATEYLSLVGFTERFSLTSRLLLFTFGVQRHRSKSIPAEDLRGTIVAYPAPGANPAPIAQLCGTTARVEGLMTWPDNDTGYGDRDVTE
jgi:hypothetical protein